MNEKKIPPSSKKRLPEYLRALQNAKDRGLTRIMSYQLANLTNVTPDSVRRDLMYVAHTNKTTNGYDVDELIFALQDEIGTNAVDEKIILIGAGNIGQGLLKYNYIPAHVGRIVCAYDIDPMKIGQIINGVPIYDFKTIAKNIPEGCNIAILATPKETVDDVVAKLVSLHICAIVNFSDGVPRKRNNLVVHQIDLSKIVTQIIYEFKNKNS